MHLLSRANVTPNQITRLVEEIGLDVTARDDNNNSILHTIATKYLTARTLKVVGNLLKKEYGDEFIIDTPDKNGFTPFQKWLKNIQEYIWWDMDVVEVWETFSADITQSEENGAHNMLHHYINGCTGDIRLAHLRKMCFDVENPWKTNEQLFNDKGKLISNQITTKKSKKKKSNIFQIPLHARPVPNNSSLFRMYFESAIYFNEPINVNVIAYFKSKKNDGVRATLDTIQSPLWLYMKHKNVKLNVVQYLVEDLKCEVTPTESQNIAFEYMKWLSRRQKIDWDVLDYFYNLTDDGNKNKIDFQFKESEFLTMLHKYCYQPATENDAHSFDSEKRYKRNVESGINAILFNCDDFLRLMNRYELSSVLDEWVTNNAGSISANPSPAAYFYENRTDEIRKDIIQLFKKLGFDTNEPINNRTPLQHYASGGNPSRYVMKSVVTAFIEHAEANVNDIIPGGNPVTMCQVMANNVDIKSLEMMVKTYGVQLINAKKRTQDIWYKFLDADNVSFDKFIALIKLYIDTKKLMPIHLFHDNKKDAEKRIQYKLYQVFTDGPNVEDEKTKPIFTDKEQKELQSKKNQRKLKIAKKLNERVVTVVDSKGGLFSGCKPIDLRSYEDVQYKDIPKKWLYPVSYEQIIKNIDEMHEIYVSCNKTAIGQKLSRSLVILDFETINKIYSQIKAIIDRSETAPKNQTINDIKLQNNNNLLMKYIQSNHRSDVSADDIKNMVQFGITFQAKNDQNLGALDIYCQQSNGEINKGVVEALIAGGCAINGQYEEKKDDDEQEEKRTEVKDAKQKRQDRDEQYWLYRQEMKINEQIQQSEQEKLDEKRKMLKEYELKKYLPNLRAKGFNSWDIWKKYFPHGFDGEETENTKKIYFAPLHLYCQLKESNLSGFRALIECGADVTIQSGQNRTAIYYLLRNSENVNKDFIEYLVKQCKINFNRQLSSGWLLLNTYLTTNKNISTDTITAFCDIGECDPHSRDYENDTSSIKAYLKNNVITKKFSFDIISCLVELGADINEPDNEGKYPIQHVLELSAPIQKLMGYVCNMVEAGAKIQHILPDDSLSIETTKLYILQNMKDGYEIYNGNICRTAAYTVDTKKKKKTQIAIALDTFGGTCLYTKIKRQNLMDFTKEMLVQKYPQFEKVIETESDRENSLLSSQASVSQEQQHNEYIIEEESKQQQTSQPIDLDNTTLKIQSLTSGQK